jgi:succinate-acetate transporter protein
VAFFVTKYLAATSTLLTGSAAGFPSAAKYQVGETLIMAFWSLFTFCFFVPTLRKNGCLMTVFGTLTLTFALLAGGQWSARCNTAAGYVGFLCGCSAIYTAVAEIWHEDLGIMMPGLRPVRFI